jgi:hypothetical protein
MEMVKDTQNPPTGDGWLDGLLAGCPEGAKVGGFDGVPDGCPDGCPLGVSVGNTNSNDPQEGVHDESALPLMAYPSTLHPTSSG